MADGPLSVLINGVEKVSFLLRDSLTINDVLNQPKTCTFITNKSYQPPGTATVVITRGTFALFAGTITTVKQTYVGENTAAANLQWIVSAINYTFLLRRRRPMVSYVATSATTIAQALISNYTSTFTSSNVQAALASVSITFDGSQDVAGCLSALATLIGGYWYIDDARDLHFFLSEATSVPDAIDNSNTTAVVDPPLAPEVDYSQQRTRVYVQGAASSTALAAAVGATSLAVLDGSLFGASGTVKSGGNKITYTGKSTYVSGVVANSVWLQGSGSAASMTWQAVAYAPSLGLYAAVTIGASGVMTSPDGITWTPRTPSSSSGWQGIAWSPTLSLFAAVSTNGIVMTSPDGTTWTARTAASAESWIDITWADGLALFVAVGLKSVTNDVMTSADGITWTGHSTPLAGTATWRKVVWAPSLALLCAYNSSTANPICTSPDGTTWTQRTMATGSGFTLAWSPTLSLFVAVAGANVGTSPDGITWTNRASALPAPTGNYAALCWSDIGIFVLLGNTSSSNVFLSADGINWAILTQSLQSTWRSVVWSPDQRKLVAVGSNGSSVPTMIASTSPGTIAALLTGVPASSVGSIAIALPAGAPVHIFVQRDDTTAQTALAAIEDGGASDGIREGYIDDPSLVTVAQCNSAGDAALALFKSPITTITYATRDLKTRSGKPITVNRTHPPISSITLTIQSATSSQFWETKGPLYQVSASSVKFQLPDLLTRIVENVGV